jgi:hypothetical protein
VRENLGQAPAGDESHHEIGNTVALADVVDRHNVRVPELCRCLCFSREARPNSGVIRQLRRKHFDRHRSVEADVARPIDDRHAAAADLALELVLITNRGDDAVAERDAHTRCSRCERLEDSLRACMGITESMVRAPVAPRQR